MFQKDQFPFLCRGEWRPITVNDDVRPAADFVRPVLCVAEGVLAAGFETKVDDKVAFRQLASLNRTSEPNDLVAAFTAYNIIKALPRLSAGLVRVCVFVSSNPPDPTKAKYHGWVQWRERLRTITGAELFNVNALTVSQQTFDDMVRMCYAHGYHPDVRSLECLVDLGVLLPSEALLLVGVRPTVQRERAERERKALADPLIALLRAYMEKLHRPNPDPHADDMEGRLQEAADSGLMVWQAGIDAQYLMAGMAIVSLNLSLMHSPDAFDLLNIMNGKVPYDDAADCLLPIAMFLHAHYPEVDLELCADQLVDLVYRWDKLPMIRDFGEGTPQ